MSEDRGYKRRLPAGVFDAGFASLATFAVGLVAVNQFGNADRGVYAVFFTAFLLGTVLPRDLILTPAEVRAVASPVEFRLKLLPRSLTLGTGPAVLGAVSVLIAVAVTAPYGTSELLTGLAVTSALATVLSPLQDHARKMLHIAAVSWRAAAVSLTQFVSVAMAIGVMFALDTNTAWIPFGALAIANAVSLTFSLLVVRFPDSASSPERLQFWELAAKGKWLVVQASGSVVAGFAVAAIVPWLAGPDALGFAESARVVATPVLVLAGGINAVLLPRSIRAAIDRDEHTARRTRRIYLSITTLAGIGYVAIVGWEWFLNPMIYIVPSAYTVSGLVALTVALNIVISALFPQANELLGARKEKALARITWSVSPILLLGGLTAGVTGAFARPLGMLGSSVTRYVLQEQELRSVYRPESGATHEVESSGASSGIDVD